MDGSLGVKGVALLGRLSHIIHMYRQGCAGYGYLYPGVFGMYKDHDDQMGHSAVYGWEQTTDIKSQVKVHRNCYPVVGIRSHLENPRLLDVGLIRPKDSK
jgi:hypothetical protein